MATPDNTLISRAEVTSIINATTKRFALVMDGKTIELGSTGWRDISALLDPAKVQTIAAEKLVFIRDGNQVTLRVSVIPTASGSVTITKAGLGLTPANAPDSILWFGGRGGTVGISTNGYVYINPATAGVQVDATATFNVDNAWPSAELGVPLGDPVVI